VEHDTVVEAPAGQFLDAGDVPRRGDRRQLGDNAALGGLHDQRVLGIGTPDILGG
jgi:hypothetical protein